MADDYIFDGGETEQNSKTRETESNLRKEISNMRSAIGNIQSRLDQLESDSEIQVRSVETDSGDRIVLEKTSQRWLSPEYLAQVLRNMGYEVDRE